MAASQRNASARDITDFAMGGTSAMFATLFTNPLEVVKTRLQLQGELMARGKHSVFYKNVPHALYVIAKNEGAIALQSGLSAMLGFQFFLNTFSYSVKMIVEKDFIKADSANLPKVDSFMIANFFASNPDFCSAEFRNVKTSVLGVYRICERRGLTTDDKGRTRLLGSAIAAAAGGALGSVAATPFYLVKTRLQSQAAKAIAVGHQHAYASALSALRQIYKSEGITGLFRGVTPQTLRGTVGSAAQMISFGYAKDFLRERGWFSASPLALSFMGANLGGLAMTLCLNPFDVAATRLSNQPVDGQNRGTLYKGTTDCFMKILRSEGVMGIYKGVVANYLRLGPHTVLLLMCWDQLKILEEYLREQN
ncbi:Solute carrier family 25 member 35 [Eumeta japonica]|uniref:Solute carrier family 25 member 35 n=1 Tax=Eumeta variegata TaxID=151549 RepID=A0A4C1Y2Y8_EUMVA|nr:Solute carrier family 25 member 35 [Eumeta japonica]